MNHKDRKHTYKRATHRAKPLRKFILYVEGKNTEKSYFDLLKKVNCKVIPVTKHGQGISKCVDFVNESYKAWMSLPNQEKEKYDKKWLVFDADGRDDFHEGIKLARKKNFAVAFSNMCFEYWFVLHFYNHDGNAIPMLYGSHSAAQIKMINDFIDKYNKKAAFPIDKYNPDSKIVENDFFDLLLAIDPTNHNPRIVTAFERAKKIHETKKANGAEFRESVTTIYELLFELGVIEKTKNGLALFRK